jgi:hypothetical protein
LTNCTAKIAKHSQRKQHNTGRRFAVSAPLRK